MSGAGGQPARRIAPKDLAEAWGVSLKTVRRHLDAGDIPAIRLGRRVLIPADVADSMPTFGQQDPQPVAKAVPSKARNAVQPGLYGRPRRGRVAASPSGASMSGANG